MISWLFRSAKFLIQQGRRWEQRREIEALRRIFPESDVIDVDGED